MADYSGGPPTCGICLSDGGGGAAMIRGRIDSCDHHFCFDCIVKWSKVKSRCPLCRRRFTSIRKQHVDDDGHDGVFPLFPSQQQHDVVNVLQLDQRLSIGLEELIEMRFEFARMRQEQEAEARRMKKFMFWYKLGVAFTLFTFFSLHHHYIF